MLRGLLARPAADGTVRKMAPVVLSVHANDPDGAAGLGTVDGVILPAGRLRPLPVRIGQPLPAVAVDLTGQPAPHLPDLPDLPDLPVVVDVDGAAAAVSHRPGVWVRNPPGDTPGGLTRFRQALADLDAVTTEAGLGPVEVCLDLTRAVDAGSVALAVRFATRLAGRVAAVRVGDGRPRLTVAELDALARVSDLLPGPVPVWVDCDAAPVDLPGLVDQVRRHLPT